MYWPFGPGYTCAASGHGRVDADSHREDTLEFRPTAVSPGGEYIAGIDKDLSEEEPAEETYHLAKNGRTVWTNGGLPGPDDEFIGTLDIGDLRDGDPWVDSDNADAWLWDGDRDDGNIVMGVSNDGCAVAVWGNNRRSAMTCELGPVWEFATAATSGGVAVRSFYACRMPRERRRYPHRVGQ